MTTTRRDPLNRIEELLGAAPARRSRRRAPPQRRLRDRAAAPPATGCPTGRSRSACCASRVGASRGYHQQVPHVRPRDSARPPQGQRQAIRVLVVLSARLRRRRRRRRVLGRGGSTTWPRSRSCARRSSPQRRPSPRGSKRSSTSLSFNGHHGDAARDRLARPRRRRRGGGADRVTEPLLTAEQVADLIGMTHRLRVRAVAARAHPDDHVRAQRRYRREAIEQWLSGAGAGLYRGCNNETAGRRCERPRPGTGEVKLPCNRRYPAVASTAPARIYRKSRRVVRPVAPVPAPSRSSASSARSASPAAARA